MIDLRHISVEGVGPFFVPAQPAERSRRSEECVREVLDAQIYSYPRTVIEDVRSILDIGCNVGAFTVWACCKWWPAQIQTVMGCDANPQCPPVALRNAYESAPWGVPLMTLFLPVAVTVDPTPLFDEQVDWGGSRTYGQTKGVRVPAIHPRDLPAADVLKVDAEGVELEVFSHYPHWAGVKVCCFEYHETRFRKSMMAICEAAGLVMRRGNPDVVEVDTQVWVRP